MIKNPPANAGDIRASGSIPGLETGLATHSSILAWIIPVDRRAWQTTVRRVAKSWTQLNATWHACSHTKNRRYIRTLIAMQIQEWVGFPGGPSGKEPDCQCRRHKRCRFNPWVGKIPWRRASCLENPMDRGARWATVQRVAKSQTRRSDLACIHACHPDAGMVLSRERGADRGKASDGGKKGQREEVHQELAVMSRKPRTYVDGIYSFCAIIDNVLFGGIYEVLRTGDF